MTVRVAVIYYSATGTVHALAQAVAEGAESAGAEVRLRRVAELAADSAIDQNPLWRQHVNAVARSVSEASLDDLVWADAYAFGPRPASARRPHSSSSSSIRPAACGETARWPTSR